MKKTKAFLCTVFFKKQENVLVCFRRCFLVLLQNKCTNFSTLRKKKLTWNGYLSTSVFNCCQNLFFLFMSKKASVVDSEGRFLFLKFFFSSSNTHEVRHRSWSKLVLCSSFWHHSLFQSFSPSAFSCFAIHSFFHHFLEELWAKQMIKPCSLCLSFFCWSWFSKKSKVVPQNTKQVLQRFKNNKVPFK